MISRDTSHASRKGFDEFSDDELAGAAAAGDTEAFDVLVRRVSPGLLRYMRRMVDEPQAAEDLAQETLLNIWKGLPRFGFRSSFRTWMFAMAHRRTADYYRRRRDLPTDDERFAELVAQGPLPAEAAENGLLVDALRTELNNLPYLSRAAWWLKEVEGLTIVEVAQVLRVSTGSVRGHLQRSRKFLVTRLAPWQPGVEAGRPDVGVEEGGRS